MTSTITSSSNSLIKHVKSLHRKKTRWETKSFFVEGIRAVEETIISKADIEFILYSDSLLESKGGEELLNLVNKNYKKVYNITEKLLKDISDTENPQGIIAVVKFTTVSLDEVILDKDNFLVLLDKVQDPGNMGTIIRTADALGANGIIVVKGCVDVFSPKTIRSTMGSIFHVPLVYHEDIEDIIETLKEKNIKVVATGLESSKPCYDVDFKEDFALVIGNEASGVSQKVLAKSDNIVKIPMKGSAESLNAAIASGVVMYEASRQRRIFK